MATDDLETLVERLREEFDDSLRVVAEFDEAGYDIEYIREEIAAEFSASDIEQLHEELVIHGISIDHLEELFKGELECTVYRFEEKTACHFAQTEQSGLYVSIDSDVPLDLRRLTEICTAAR